MLLNPKTFQSACPDETSREIMKKTIALFERKGKRRLKEDDQERVWYADFLEFVKENQIFATLLTPSEYGAPGCALGHVAQLRVQRDPRLLRAAVLVHVAGVDPRAGADLDEPQRGGEEEDRPAPQGRRHLRFRPLGEGARRRHLFHRHAAQAPGRRQLRGRGRQVLHRQRQRGGDRLDVREDVRFRRLRLLRGRTRTTRSSSS